MLYKLRRGFEAINREARKPYQKYRRNKSAAILCEIYLHEKQLQIERGHLIISTNVEIWRTVEVSLRIYGTESAGNAPKACGPCLWKTIFVSFRIVFLQP